MNADDHLKEDGNKLIYENSQSFVQEYSCHPAAWRPGIAINSEV